MKDYEREIKNLQEELDCLKKDFENSKKITTKVLEECKKQGIKIVSIGKATDKIESAKEWSERTWGCRGSIFADEKDNHAYPAIWTVASKTGIGGGCGNTGQYQVDREANLMEGVWELKGNVWRKIG